MSTQMQVGNIARAAIAARSWLAVMCAGLTGLAAWSSPAAAPSTFIIDNWRTDQGLPQQRLPQSSVFSVTQTRDSYLWLGTLNGLVRFDGERFTVFDESNTPGLPSSQVVHLFEDSRGWLWVGTDSGGVAVIRDGKVESLGIGQGSRASRLMATCETADGAVWLYTADGQLWRYFNGQRIPNVIDDGTFSSCRALITETNGTLWVGTDRRQLAVATNITSAFEPFAVVTNLPGPLDFLLASRTGGYWRFADGRIEKWNGTKSERFLAEYPWTNPAARIMSACEDSDGNLIVGVLDGGVYWFDTDGTFKRVGIGHSGILSVNLDREGSLWVGTDGGGLYRAKRPVCDVIARDIVVQSTCEEPNGGLWFGTQGGGARFVRGNQERTYGTTSGLATPYVSAVMADPQGQLWVGTRGGGLYRRVQDRFEVVAPLLTFAPEVFALHSDRARVLWVGTPNGLACWDGMSWRGYTTADGLAPGAVRAIADDAEGNLWIGTQGGGLNQLREGRFTAFRKNDDGLPSDNITSLLVGRDGALWVGTSSGLARFKDGKLTRFTSADGLASNGIAYLTEDGDYLWIGSNAGLMRVALKSFNDFADGRIQKLDCRAFDTADGLPTSECSVGSQPAASRTRDGKLWFPTIRGLVGIEPARLRLNTNPPPVSIESVLVENREQLVAGPRVPLPAGIILPANTERLEIQFTSLNLASPERTLFRHQLEGYESTWSEPRASRVASFPKLPPGEYRFRVAAANEDGVWNETGASLAITVLPPFWRTWWFLTLTVLTVLGLVAGVVHFISTQRLKQQIARLRQKEALEHERSRIARDLHDQLGANLTRVSLLGELIETDKDQPVEVETHARQICKTAGETASALDEIVWAANPANDTLEGLVNYICKYAQDFLGSVGLRHRLEMPAHLTATDVAPDFRHNVFLVAKEAMNNVAKHAQAQSVWVRARIEDGALVIEVQDDGRGPADAATATERGRNGLRNMSRRMEDIGGTFSIGPAPERGTLVRLKAPLPRVI
jgi:ligand-binding sensor domain-containing protein/signal transduction histidine kinase